MNCGFHTWATIEAKFGCQATGDIEVAFNIGFSNKNLQFAFLVNRSFEQIRLTVDVSGQLFNVITIFGHDIKHHCLTVFLGEFKLQVTSGRWYPPLFSLRLFGNKGLATHAEIISTYTGQSHNDRFTRARTDLERSFTKRTIE
ncbi:Uncharacterised protein [Vibrio cholerae]|uniref:Uncharacterized protein n=1 Tax=Vibrio cholerae TaxID=666 RepID=A0A655Z6M5_VIBCL|nr:Uncharacterised protein [Vibrio cholerae]